MPTVAESTDKESRRLVSQTARVLDALHEAQKALSDYVHAASRKKVGEYVCAEQVEECRALAVILKTYYDLIYSTAPLRFIVPILDHVPAL